MIRILFCFGHKIAIRQIQIVAKSVRKLRFGSTLALVPSKLLDGSTNSLVTAQLSCVDCEAIGVKYDTKK